MKLRQVRLKVIEAATTAALMTDVQAFTEAQAEQNLLGVQFEVGGAGFIAAIWYST